MMKKPNRSKSTSLIPSIETLRIQIYASDSSEPVSTSIEQPRLYSIEQIAELYERWILQSNEPFDFTDIHRHIQDEENGETNADRLPPEAARTHALPPLKRHRPRSKEPLSIWRFLRNLRWRIIDLTRTSRSGS